MKEERDQRSKTPPMPGLLRCAREWIERYWWGLLIAYAILVVGSFFLAYNTLSTRPSNPSEFEPPWQTLNQRWVFSVLLALLAGAHVTLLLDLLGRLLYRKTTPRSATERVVDYEYTVSTAKDFYDATSTDCDQRNSNELLLAHNQVAAQIRAHPEYGATMNVLDLGGGTGLVAHRFHACDNMKWDCVDFSHKMVELFRTNLADTTLKPTARFSDIHQLLKDPTEERYDVILLSLVLTSMGRNPDWAMLADRLRPGGRLIIADIDAAYTATHPYYVVKVKKTHGLRPRPLELAPLMSEVEAAGFTSKATSAISKGKVNYAFVVCLAFDKPSAGMIR